MLCESVNVCNAFEASGEFQTLVATLYGNSTSDNQRTEQLVNTFYLGAYGRIATSTELQQQRDALNTAAAQGLTQVQAQAETFGRSLFTGQVNDAGLSSTQFVTNLYEAFLQRGPDAGGLSFWAGQASVGQGRQNVLGAFATSGAFRELSGTLYRETFWLMADHLGTPRMIVDKSGSLATMKRHDYLPFGEELLALTGGRTTTQGYTSDSVRQKFTSKERDNETGLDYSLARYYSATQGRFTSVDPLIESAKPAQPQGWNRYSYTINNPLKYIDPTGLIWGTYTDNLGQEHYHWYKDQKELDASGATVATTSVYQAANGSWIRLNSQGPNADAQDAVGRNGWEAFSSQGEAIENHHGSLGDNSTAIDQAFSLALSDTGGRIVGRLGEKTWIKSGKGNQKRKNQNSAREAPNGCSVIKTTGRRDR